MDARKVLRPIAVSLDDRLTDAEKVEALVAMLTKERAYHRRARIRWARTLTSITREWESLFDDVLADGVVLPDEGRS